MTVVKLVITMKPKLLAQIDRWVADGCYPNRSQVIEGAVREKAERARRRRLAEEAGKLNRKEERALAEEGLAAESRRFAY